MWLLVDGLTMFLLCIAQGAVNDPLRVPTINSNPKDTNWTKMLNYR